MEPKPFIPLTDFTQGWNDRVDATKSPGGLVMQDVMISDRGGVQPRPGEELLGAADTTSTLITGLHTFTRRDGEDVMLRASGTEVEYFHEPSSSWTPVRQLDYSDGAIFDFEDFSVEDDELEYVYFSNAVDPLQRWPGYYGVVDGDQTMGATELKVDTVLLPETFYSGTASSVTTTTLTIGSSDWATDQYINYWVYITDGVNQDAIRVITTNSATTLTFSPAITGFSGTPTFQIKRVKWTANYLMTVDGVNLTATGFTRYNYIDVGGGLPQDFSDGDPVTRVPDTLVNNSAPRGDILKALFNQLYVSGAQDFTSTIYRSKLNDGSDYTFSSPRLSGEGDIIDVPEGGGPVTDLNIQEDRMYVFKRDYIEKLFYSQDGNDLVLRDPLIKSPLIGTTGRTFRVGNDIMFANPSNEITSIGRIENYADFPQKRNLAYRIKNGIKDFAFDTSRGITWKNFTFIACKATSASTSNDQIIVYDNDRQIWLGTWTIPAADFTIRDNNLYYGSAASKEVYRMMTGLNKLKGSDTFALKTLFRTPWVNKTQDGQRQQRFDTISVDGYILEGTKMEFSLFYDFETEPRLTWTFDPTKTDYLLEKTAKNIIGTHPIGVLPLAIELSGPQTEFGEQRFKVYFRVPMIPHNYVSLSFGSDGKGQYYDILDVSANFEDTGRINDLYHRSFEDVTTYSSAADEGGNYLLEDGSGNYLLEDDSGDYKLE